MKDNNKNTTALPEDEASSTPPETDDTQQVQQKYEHTSQIIHKIANELNEMLQHVCESDNFTDDEIRDFVLQDYQLEQALNSRPLNESNLSDAKSILMRRLLTIKAMREKKFARLNYTQRKHCILIANVLEQL